MNNDYNTNNQNPGTEQSTDVYQQTPYTQEGQYQQAPYQPPVYVDESGLFSENKLARRNGLSANVKLSDWMKADCLMFLTLLPFGGIIYFVICCILAFSSKTSRSMKTRYQANLIWAAISIVLSILLIVGIVALLTGIGMSLNELIRTSLEESYY